MDFVGGLVRVATFQYGLIFGRRGRLKTDYRITVENDDIQLVSDLIEEDNRTWKKKVVVEDRCIRCHQGVEDCNHVFRFCPTTNEIWSHLNISWVFNNSNLEFWNWLTWVFIQGTIEQCRVFCYGLWLIWTNRNKQIYKGKSSTSWDISKQVISYISELDGIKEKVLILEANTRLTPNMQRSNVTIYFDAAFDP
ncbi:hypothetical protein J1N35_019541 [Gossypium stocksii]|uniref:Reverse transcriptase zinc-binding domain-containing protein n=1 Tax=Gossypium stocksii TaxID=47602 RepID=A0A9D3VRH1_9ROSI|nr:hypothetical protein J1N35_019541 [Gossypium stocksii]